MKENRYDDEVFFAKYAQMPRSKDGLRSAGEWPTLKAMMPELSGKRLLDLGCGYGWHCGYALTQGASSVLGVDLSEKMLCVAREKVNDPRACFACAAIEDVDLPAHSFDVVLSSLTLHYIADLNAVYDKVYDLLCPGGTFLFSCEHPVFTAQGPQDWVYTAQGEIDHFPVDRYFISGARTATFLGEQVTKYHRTLTEIVNGLLARGFTLTGLAEPQPAPELLDTVPGMRDELRRPMMLIVRAHKRP